MSRPGGQRNGTGAWRTNGSDIAVCALITAILCLTWVPRTTGPADLRWDAAVYYVLGTSLAAGEGYALRSEPTHLTANVWPPLLPVVIAAAQWTLHTSDPVVVGRWLRAFCFLVWLAFILGTFVVLRSMGDRRFAAAGTLLTGLHMTTVWLSDRVYADLPFAVCVVAAVGVAIKRPRHSEALFFVSASCAFLFRTAGLAIFAAWLLDAALSAQWRTVLRRALLIAVPVAAWSGYVAWVERGADYTHPPYEYARADYQLYNVSYTRNMRLRDPNVPALGVVSSTDLVMRAVRNVRTTVTHLGEAVTALERDWSTLVVTATQLPVVGRLIPWRTIRFGLALYGCLIIAGLILMAARGERFAPLMVISYVGLLSLLPTDYQWPRYLAGIAPILCAALLIALQAIASRARRIGFGPRAAAVVPVAAVVAAAMIQTGTLWWYFTHDLRRVTVENFSGHRVEYSLFTYDPAFAAFDAGITWVQAHARAEDLVLSSMPHWVYLRTGLHGVTPPFEQDLDTERRLIAGVAPRFAIVDSSGFSASREYAAPVLSSDAQWTLRFADATGLVQVYEHVGKRR